MNILIPMAGKGSRFVEAGFTLPKPLIDVHGKPMIQRVIENLHMSSKDKYIFIIQKEHDTKFDLAQKLKSLCPTSVVMSLDYTTKGAACTCMLAQDIIDNDEPLLIANCDQIIEWNKSIFQDMRSTPNDGIIFLFDSDSNKNSYVEIMNGYIVRAVEKEVISMNATCGIYYWNHGKDFVGSVETMIKANDTTNNEFYVCPSYNYLKTKKILPFFVYKNHPIGTPEDLRDYLTNVEHV